MHGLSVATYEIIIVKLLLYHSRSRISLLLQESKPRTSVNNKDILQTTVIYAVTSFYLYSNLQTYYKQVQVLGLDIYRTWENFGELYSTGKSYW